MFAVVRTGGKQYRVAAGDKIVVEKIGGEAGDVLRLDDVLFAGNGDAAGLTVEAQIIAQAKAEKVIVFKKRRRHNYRRKNGHRQQHTILRITAVGDDTIETAAARRQAANGGIDEASTINPQPTQTPGTQPATSDLQPQAPLKVEGTESPMVDAPAGDSDTTA